jgi:hypothetical protein
MPGLVSGIHVFAELDQEKTWMAGTSPAMTKAIQVLSLVLRRMSTVSPASYARTAASPGTVAKPALLA